MGESAQFGRYRLVELLGRGGMAEVWKAHIDSSHGLPRTLVKRLLPRLASDEEFVAMFMREAQLCSMLSHSNIVEVFELGELNGEYYLAMEYVHGRDVHAVVAARPKTPPPPGLAALVARDVSRALAYAYDVLDEYGNPLRAIHRDVTPSNVMLTVDGNVKLVDFGVAKALSRDALSVTRVGAMRGKLGYSAPEQLSGKTVDHRTDLFALGIMTHELLTGRRLFHGETDLETMGRVIEGPIYPPSKINAAVPEALDALVMRALERDPDKRFQSGDEMADAFGLFVSELEFGAMQVTELLRERFPDLDRRATMGSLIVPNERRSEVDGDTDPAGERPTLPNVKTLRHTASFVHTVDDMGAWTADTKTHAVSPMALDNTSPIVIDDEPKTLDYSKPPPARRRSSWPIVVAFVIVAALTGFLLLR